MEEFIQMVTSRLGLGASTARSATGGLLTMIRDRVGTKDFSELAEKLPGAEEMMRQAPAQTAPPEKATGAPEPSGAAGLLGGLMSKAASAAGGPLGSAMSLTGLLGGAGVGLGQAGSFVTMFVEFVKGKAGAGLVDRVLGQIPELGKLARAS